MAKLTVKEVEEIFGVKTANLRQEDRDSINAMVGAFTEIVNKSNDGLISNDELTRQLSELSQKMAGIEALSELRKENDELCKQVKSLGETIEKLQGKGISMAAINKFDERINEMFESEKFKDYVEGKTTKTGVFKGFSLKDTVSMANNYDGNILPTMQTDRVVNPVGNKNIHMRQLVTLLTGDEQCPNVAYTRVKLLDRNARFVTENGKLPASSFTLEEVTASAKRLGTHIRISKTMLKSRAFVRSFILNMLPEAVYMAEDWNMLFGNGKGNNLLGIANHEGVEPVEKIITGAISTGKAGDVASIEPYEGGGAMVTFAAPHSEITDGMVITFANATATALNAPHDVVKVNDRQVLLLDVELTAAETSAAAAAITFTVNHAAYKSIEVPNAEDAINTATAVMTFAEYAPTMLALNPITVNAIASEKDALGRNLGLVKIVNGVKYIGSLPVVEYTGIPAGKYILGDFDKGAQLIDYTSLNLEWADDVESKLSNEVVLIAQEEVIFPVFCPCSFSYGDLRQLKAAITAPVAPAAPETPVEKAPETPVEGGEE